MEREALLIRRYQADYMEKVFYFCLKKTGNPAEAEELASEIAVNVLVSLQRGAAPERFSGWVWAVAHHRYARWAEDKRRAAALVARGDIGDYEVMDAEGDVEKQWISAEALSLLRRELAFISREYREIIAAYYLNGKKIEEIASALRLPPGTVMTKLHRGRKTLKEGMDMAREFGKRSYQPENISFSSSGNQPSGLPWQAVGRMIPVNILCAANDNPSTVEELAMELGIAVPYMEEEVQLLEEAELLIKLDKERYLTSFFISPRECQNEILALACDFVEENGTALWQTALRALAKARGSGADTDAYAENEAQMYFALTLWNCVEKAVLPPCVFTSFRRRDGGNWGFSGFEQGAECRLPRAPFSNQCSKMNGLIWNGYQADFWRGEPQHPRFTERIYAHDVPNGDQLPTLRAVVRGEGERLTEEQSWNLRYLLNMNICRRDPNGALRVNAIVFNGIAEGREAEAVADSSEYRALVSAARQYAVREREIVAKYCHQALKNDLSYYAAMSMSVRPVLAAYLAEQGYYSGHQAQFCAFYC